MAYGRKSLIQVQATEIHYQLPKVLVGTTYYQKLCAEAKFLYMLINDRLKLSLQTAKDTGNFVDEHGDVYVIYPNNELSQDTGYGKDKIIKLKKELIRYNLLDEERQGMKQPNRLYPKNVVSDPFLLEIAFEDAPNPWELYEVGNSDFKNSEIPTSRTRQNRNQEVGNIEPSKNNLSKNDKRDNDTNRYQNEIPLSTLSDSEAFQMGQHGFLSSTAIQRLSLFGDDAKILENKIYQAKRQVEKEYSDLLQGLTILGEVWVTDLEREIDKLIFKIKTGENEEKPIKNIPGYFYKMMTHFWKMALLVETEQGFVTVSNWSDYIKEFPEACPSIIRYYYPNKLSTSQLNKYLDALSKRERG
ncbi:MULTISPECIES: replication initiator protein A [unclassified Streptococcus]|uniref:replication initiator protein A n=1 Tax=unclassified Streptococcus TaxID=2608887 RepID=UPI00211B672C|nr:MULTISPECIES: replication initiator protein A [unclassified Streptococcus]MCQ9211692.1 replication initiator protein A [Streptococcus sp. B01]MCQ9213119.1 replication initiator protein A [Streptococcus sp. O1]